MDASPSKRRVLAPLDANTRSPAAASNGPASRLGVSKLHIPIALDPTKTGAIKRPLIRDISQQEYSLPVTKKPRISDPEERRPITSDKDNNVSRNSDSRDCDHDDESIPRRSNSPDESSIFDTAAIDTSQATTITEPDPEATPPTLPAPPPPRQLTREEAKERAEILRLRLGLATYKLRTGQTDVPLERLVIKPLGTRLPRLPSLARPGESDGVDEAPRRQPMGQRKALPATAPGPCR
ncbi:hypothetical protein F5B20DRAFT_520186 [Whalleya microplaca]|nr:hypothetical protein F5B20DRAFT_520186 [Whalleya microplaca]